MHARTIKVFCLFLRFSLLCKSTFEGYLRELIGIRILVWKWDWGSNPFTSRLQPSMLAITPQRFPSLFYSILLVLYLRGDTRVIQ